MRRIISVLCIVFLVLGTLAGCMADPSTGTEAITTEEPVESTQEQEESTEEKNTEVDEQLKLSINGIDISSYKIVYAKHLYLKITDKATLGSDYDFNKECAIKLRDCIKELTGIELECVQDISATETDYEILVGMTNRQLTKELQLAKQTAYSYRLSLEGSRLVICGAMFGNTWHAIDFLMDDIKAGFAGKTSYDISGEYNLSGENHLTTIACVGDSITEGSKATNLNIYSYPATLQRLLWKDCAVYNYGYGGYRLRKDLGNNYFTTNGWEVLTTETEKFDVVLIMLGTNDCGEGGDTNWNEESSALYKKDMAEFVDTLYEKNKNIAPIVMTCPAYFGSGARTRNLSKVREAQAEIVSELAAKGIKISLYDMYAYTKDVIGGERFPDKIHLNDEGYVMMAQGIAEMLKENSDTKLLLESYAE